MQDFAEESRVTARPFSACFDAAFGLVSADEAKGEAAADGHIFRTMSGAVSGQIVLELDVEPAPQQIEAHIESRPACQANSFR